MSTYTKVYEEKMQGAIAHLGRELASIRAGRANPAILDKVTVDYYGTATPINQMAAVAVAEARILTITPWDSTLLHPIEHALLASDIGINPTNDGRVIRLVFPAPTEERRRQRINVGNFRLGIPLFLKVMVHGRHQKDPSARFFVIYDLKDDGYA